MLKLPSMMLVEMETRFSQQPYSLPVVDGVMAGESLA